jgi:hypothetical protein
MKKTDYITLYHYSNNKINGKLLPDFFGNNSYTDNDIKSCNVKRIFFYDKKNPEYLLSSCNFLYTCRILKNQLYNITIDPAGFLKKYNSLYQAVKIIKKHYQGIIYHIGDYNIINVFYGIKSNSIERR